MGLLSPLSCLSQRGRVAGGSLGATPNHAVTQSGGETGYVPGPGRFAGSTQVS